MTEMTRTTGTTGMTRTTGTTGMTGTTGTTEMTERLRDLEREGRRMMLPETVSRSTQTKNATYHSRAKSRGDERNHTGPRAKSRGQALLHDIGP